MICPNRLRSVLVRFSVSMRWAGSSALSSKNSKDKGPQELSSPPPASKRAATHFQLDSIQSESMVLYKDDDIVVLNKPAGLPVHVGPKVSQSLTDYLHYWQYEQADAPLLAHRLDKETSGVLVLTRHKEAARHIAKLFYQRNIIKKYLAITVNVPENEKGCVKSPLSVRNIATPGKHHTMNRVVMTSKSTTDDKMAITEYEVVSVPPFTPNRCCLLQLNLITGYRHQLRVHLADGLNCPVLGDHKFGGHLFRKDQGLRRKIKAMTFEKGHIYLHAQHIEIPHYFGKNRAPLAITAPLPKHYKNTLGQIGLKIKT